MPLDLDPIFYTKTMVKILKSQSSNQSALELADKILERDPENREVLQLREGIQEDIRLAFERFRNGSKVERPTTEGQNES